MEYFDVPGAYDGSCPNNRCLCEPAVVRIPRGRGCTEIYGSAVNFWCDACLTRDAVRKATWMEKRILFGEETFTATVMCGQGARKRGFNLKAAAAVAKYRGKTGWVSLRPALFDEGN